MKLVWTDPAVADLQDIYDYIAKDSSSDATKFVDRIFSFVEKLEQLPRIGRKVPEDGREHIRELIVHGYRIIYRVRTEHVQTLSVIHGRRDTAIIIQMLEKRD